MPGQIDSIMQALGSTGQSWRGGPDYSNIPLKSSVQGKNVPSFHEWVRTMGFGSYQPVAGGDRLWRQPPPEQMAQLVPMYNEYVQGLQGQTAAAQDEYDWEVNEKNRRKNEIFSQYVNPYAPPPGYKPWGGR